MARDIARRDLLRGRVKPVAAVFRPPFAVLETVFIDLCKGCPNCIDVCPENILRVGADKRAELVFGRGECTFCGDCETACGKGALDKQNARPWGVVPSVKGGCLAFNSIVCRACGDNCDEEAISFRLMVNGRSLPIVDEATCTGCGACISVCPNGSIAMIEKAEAQNSVAREGASS